ncbi:MAG: glycosyltransferase family 39 protein [Verrucomicrobia bacterium]|nr:glycosyltransferase family 39 protein [Verrucomicrobiota bacterium]
MSTPEEEKLRPIQAAIQDTVHSLDIGIGQRVLRGVLLAVALGTMLLLYAGNQFSSLRYPEAMDQAQLGRNLLRGDGYTTQFIRPLSMWQQLHCPRWRNAMLEKHPDLMNPPAYPVLIGTLFYMVQKGNLWPGDEPPPSWKWGEPQTKRQRLFELMSWPYWTWTLSGIAGAWLLFWVVPRGLRMKLRKGELPWHGVGILFCLMLFALFWAPATSFKVGPEQAATGFGPDRWIVYGLGIPLTLINGWLIYFIARRLFDRRVGVTAAALFVLSETICQYAISGLNVMFAMMWLGLATFALVVANDLRAQERRPVIALLLTLLAGAIIGMAFLVKYSAGWLLLPACILAWRMWGLVRGGWVALGMIAMFLTLAAPWMARNYWMCNNPLGLATTGIYEKVPSLLRDNLERSLDPNFGAATLKMIAMKTGINAREIWTDSPWTSGGGVIMAFFAAALFYRFRRLSVNRFKWFAVGSAGVFFLVTCVLGLQPRPPHCLAQEGNLLVLAIPLITMYGTAIFFTMLDRLQIFIPLWRGCVVALFVAATALPVGLRLIGPTADRYAYPPYHPPKIAEAAGYLDLKEFMASDQPWAVAWYGNRRCFWLPMHRKQFYDINDLHQHVAALLLTPITLNRRFLSEIMFDEWWPWADVLRFLKVPQDFPLKEAIPPERFEGINMLFFCDRKRWADAAPSK